MKKIFDQSFCIPDKYLSGWKSDYFVTFRRNLRIMGIAGMIGYALLHLVHFFVMPGMSLSFKLKMVAVFSVISVALIAVSYLARNVTHIKLLGFVVTCVLLGFFIVSNLDIERLGHPYTFTTTIIIMLFFMSLMLSWDVRDVFVIALLCLISLFIYHTLSPEPGVLSAGTALESKLFWNGVLNLFVGTLFCAVVRYYHNQSANENYLLLKNVEEQKQNIEALNKELLRDLNLAKQIHETLIPKHYENRDFDIRVVYEPISQIGGDYASFLFVDENKLLFLMSDVTGHGVPAALVVNRFENEFQRLAREIKRPGDVMCALNKFMVEKLGATGMYLTAFCGLIDLKQGKLIYTNYGHPDQYLIKGLDKQVVPLCSLTTMVGVLDESNIHEKEEDVVRGDRILLYTDGVIESRNQEEEEFGMSGIMKAINDVGSGPDNSLDQLVYEYLKKHTAGSFKDDVFLLSISYKKSCLKRIIDTNK